MTKKTIVAWSGGKDSAMALNTLLSDKENNVCALLTTVTADYGRISMHGVRTDLLKSQAKSLGLELVTTEIPAPCTDEEYCERMKETIDTLKQRGFTTIAFGDLFLEDVRSYREEQLDGTGLECSFPIWGVDTSRLAREFIDSGFRAVISCVDTEKLDGEFAGSMYSKKLLESLPKATDPCGELGEFHTFVFDGPIFKEPVGFKRGEVVLRDKRFSYCDLLASRERD